MWRTAIASPGTEEFPDESGEPTLADGDANISTEDGPFDVADSDHRFVVDWATGGHTDEDVPLTAVGPGAERLTGVHENTFVHQVMLETLFGGDGHAGNGKGHGNGGR